MNAFDFGIWLVGAFVVFVVCGAALLFVLAWASDKWDNRHAGEEDEHGVDLPPPWARRKK
jgi:hypothetical protein